MLKEVTEEKNSSNFSSMAKNSREYSINTSNRVKEEDSSSLETDSDEEFFRTHTA